MVKPHRLDDKRLEVLFGTHTKKTDVLHFNVGLAHVLSIQRRDPIFVMPDTSSFPECGV